MIYIDDIGMIYNVQAWFIIHNRPRYLDNDSQVWAQAFRDWLAQQGCEIEHSASQVLRNSLGIAPNYDRLRFHNDHDATVFALRWSS